jgi:hypothetical protein
MIYAANSPECRAHVPVLVHIVMIATFCECCMSVNYIRMGIDCQAKPELVRTKVTVPLLDSRG